jgi:hypothetical protein
VDEWGRIALYMAAIVSLVVTVIILTTHFVS